MEFIRIKRKDIIDTILASSSAIEVDEAFDILIQVWKKYGRRVATQKVIGLLDPKSLSYQLYKAISYHTRIVDISVLQQYRRELRAHFNLHYATISSFGFEINAKEEKDILKVINDLDMGNVHVQKEMFSGVGGLQVESGGYIYKRSIDNDINNLLQAS